MIRSEIIHKIKWWIWNTSCYNPCKSDFDKNGLHIFVNECFIENEAAKLIIKYGIQFPNVKHLTILLSNEGYENMKKLVSFSFPSALYSFKIIGSEKINHGSIQNKFISFKKLNTQNSYVVFDQFVFKKTKLFVEAIILFSNVDTLHFKNWKFRTKGAGVIPNFEGVTIKNIVFTKCWFEDTKLFKEALNILILKNTLNKVIFHGFSKGGEKIQKMVDEFQREYKSNLFEINQ